MVTSQEQSYKHALSHTPSLKASCVAVSADRARKRRRVGGIKVGGRGKEGGKRTIGGRYIYAHTHMYTCPARGEGGRGGGGGRKISLEST